MSEPWALFTGRVFERGHTSFPKAVQFDQELSRHARFLYSILLAYAWEDPYSFPGRTRLCEDMGCNQNYVSDYLKELDDVWIKIRRRGQGKTNVYYFLSSRGAIIPELTTGDNSSVNDSEEATNKQGNEEAVDSPSGANAPRGNPWLSQLYDLCAVEKVYLTDEQMKQYGAGYKRLQAREPERRLISVVGKHADRIIAGGEKLPSPQQVFTDLYGTPKTPKAGSTKKAEKPDPAKGGKYAHLRRN